MSGLTLEDLARATLPRQFPEVGGTDGAAVVDVFNRLGPWQSQVPRAPFLAAAARVPGVAYATLVELFETAELVKTSSLRGTVHTSTRAQYCWTDSVARGPRAAQLRRALRLGQIPTAELVAELEAYARDEWRTRSELVAHARDWLATREPASASAVAGTYSEALVWGHSGLLRRPPDRRWETRTDILHRTARAVLAELGVPPPALPEPGAALAELVRVHLGAYGPATRADLAFFSGTGVGSVDDAVRRLGDEVVVLTGPQGERYLDLAEPPLGGQADPGLRLLPEFDGLFFGYAGPHRDRFIDTDQLPRVWATVNGLASPCVLDGGRITATWKTVPVRGGLDLQVRMLQRQPIPPVDRFADAVQATEQALTVSIRDVRIEPG